MARIVIREQDLTGNTINQDFTDIALVPGFVKYPKEEYSTPQLCWSEGEFIDMFGNEPAITASTFAYTLKYNNNQILNPATGSQLFYLTSKDIESLSDSGYHYARELLYRGLPIYYCPMNKKSGDKLVAYDGSQINNTTNTTTSNGSDENPNVVAGATANPSAVCSGTITVITTGARSYTPYSGSETFKTAETTVASSVSISSPSSFDTNKVFVNDQLTYGVNVEGTNIERFLYEWTIKSGQDTRVISTNKLCKFSLKSLGLTTGTSFTISCKVVGEPLHAESLSEINIAQDPSNPTTAQIIAKGKMMAIDAASKKIYSQFAEEMINFFNVDENIELLKDRGLYNFKYLTTGGYPLFKAAKIPSDGTSESIANWDAALRNLLSICGQKTTDDSKDYIAEDGSTQRQGRGDCVLLIDHQLDKSWDTMDLYENVREWFENPINVGKESLEFAAMFTPWANYNMTYTSKSVNVNMPASFAYLTCLADSIQAYDNWNAIAGVTRGSVKNLNEILLNNPLTNTKANKCQADPETAESGRVSINCITEIKPYGQVIWGNRTLQQADPYKHVTAMGFLNLRNEVSDIKKLVYRAARRWMFEQNTSILWINFKSTITPLLERMVHGYGLSRYEIRRGEKTAKHKLYAEIRIWPIYAVEYIDVTIQILDEETLVTEE